MYILISGHSPVRGGGDGGLLWHLFRHFTYGDGQPTTLTRTTIGSIIISIAVI